MVPKKTGVVRTCTRLDLVEFMSMIFGSSHVGITGTKLDGSAKIAGHLNSWIVI